MLPTCDSCSQSLELIDLAAGRTAGFGTPPVLYGGVVCLACGRVECSRCKGPANRKPCRFCGGEVKPAYAKYLRWRTGSTSQEADVDGKVNKEGWEAFAAGLVLLGGIGGAIGAIMLYPAGSAPRFASVPASAVAALAAVLSVALGGTLHRFNRLTVALFEAWRLVVGVIFGAMAYLEPMTQPAAQRNAPNGPWMIVWFVVCWYLLTWPLGRALRRRRNAGTLT